jgi:hypothetical protein
MGCDHTDCVAWTGHGSAGGADGLLGYVDGLHHAPLQGRTKGLCKKKSINNK